MVTVILSKVEPLGTVTVRLFAEAAVTVALVAPKKTEFCAAVALKPLPFMITDVPTGPEAGAKPEMTGTANALNVSNKVADNKPVILSVVKVLVILVKISLILRYMVSF